MAEVIQIFSFPWQVCKALAHFASSDRLRAALNCVSMEIHADKLVFCATDGRRMMAMVYFEAQYQYEADEPMKVSIPLQYIKEMGVNKMGSKVENSVLTVELLDEDTGECQLALEAIHKKMSWRARSGNKPFPAWRSLCSDDIELRRGSGALNADLMADISKVWKALGNSKVPAVAAYHANDESAIYVRFLSDDRLFALVMPLRVDAELFPSVSWPSWAASTAGGPEFDLKEDVVSDPETEGEHDEMFEQARDLILKKQRASTALLQRSLRIGYNRAARLMEQLEAAGVVGPENGSAPREILVSEGGAE